MAFVAALLSVDRLSKSCFGGWKVICGRSGGGAANACVWRDEDSAAAAAAAADAAADAAAEWRSPAAALQKGLPF